MSTPSGAGAKAFVHRYLWLAFLGLGAIGFLTTYLLLPHKSEIDSPLQVIYKLLVFFVICCGISLFPNRSPRLYLLLLIPPLGFLGYIIPRANYFAFIGIPEGVPNAPGEYYTYQFLMLYPAILLSIILAYRLGGGTPGNCLKIAASGVIVVFSGYLDLLFYIVNPTGIPETIQYAHHIEIILGHYPSYGEGIVFALMHLPLLVIVLLLPLDKWIQRLLGRAEVPAQAAETAQSTETDQG